MSMSGKNSGATNPSVSYEPKDVNAVTILKYLAALLLTVFVSMIVVWWVYRGLARRTAPQESYVSPLHQSAGKIFPPEPRLQGAPGHQLPPQEELRQMRTEAQATLESYGWVDANAGVARIPIDQAMKLLVERGPQSTGLGPRARASVERAAAAGAKTIPGKHP